MRPYSRIIIGFLATIAILFTSLLFASWIIADPIKTPIFSTSDLYMAKVCQSTEGKNSVDLNPQEYAFHEISWGEKIVTTHRGFRFMSNMGPYGVQANEIFSLTAESSIVDSEINQLNDIWMVDFVIRNTHVLVTFFDSESYGKMFTLYPNECITITSNTISIPFNVQTSP